MQQICYSQQINFAVIGDYGNAGADELAVANLVKSRNPDFIITLGDNNYDIGSIGTIDANIGQYFHEYIYPYAGTYGPGDTVNRFFPSLGNHDWGTTGAWPYLAYFTLPGNERYYDFVKGPVHFFVIDSDTSEVDGRDSNSVQAQWLKAGLASSSSKYNIVYFHHPPYCSGLVHGSETIMRWPFKRWGATTVLAAHEHLYERLTLDGLTYFVNGLGGNLRSYFGFTIAGSQVRYRGNYGAMFVSADDDSLVLKFYDINNVIRDNFKILPHFKKLNLSVLIEGMYDASQNAMIPDTLIVNIRNSYPPYAKADSAISTVDSSGSGEFNFKVAANSTDYYLEIAHRNSINTWSALPVKFILNEMNVNFTLNTSQAYGNNLVLKGSKFCIYSGDVNKDGFIDLNDLVLIQNDASGFLSGYLLADINGDTSVDLQDVLISYNNSVNFVRELRP
ncbi:MAG TPA: metallophosphoesterase [Ignavibacteria bacterium]|nr:metallophosphoesterase [Ignavibacteria bacterium]HMR39988.1 metallophosphoesterase [Ignavibacteria bacterium]